MSNEEKEDLIGLTCVENRRKKLGKRIKRRRTLKKIQSKRAHKKKVEGEKKKRKD